MLKAWRRDQTLNIYCSYSPSTNKMSSYLFSVATISWRWRGARPGCGVFVLVCELCPWVVWRALWRCVCSRGLRQPGALVAWHVVLCRGCRRRPASLVCLVAPRWCAAPRLVRSLSVPRSASPLQWCLSLSGAYAPEFTGQMRGARGGPPKTGLLVPAAGPRRWAPSASYPFGAPLWGCPWRVPWFHIPSSTGHTEAWESVSQTQRAPQKEESPYP